jgi:hypothetical protein
MLTAIRDGEMSTVKMHGKLSRTFAYTEKTSIVCPHDGIKSKKRSWLYDDDEEANQTWAEELPLIIISFNFYFGIEFHPHFCVCVCWFTRNGNFFIS